MAQTPLDLRVGTVSSRVRVIDADALLSPETLERIVRAVKERLDDDASVTAQRDADRRVAHRGRG